ncbi:hypothetical protein HRI96_07410 [Treponema parvum]|uniref:Uncharacterized protein n=1 Tax=Treponema parvum TaxID=138851 RepID=A0A975EZW9_9SPIR|nr:hypothetical protein [Treponema parvum]QTQ12035.1 hypothetical protein HRI96_07410 [Treponema parvum]QTQ15989.1 hypothetical protein HXT04_04340 [Treponema parvum]
MKINSGRRIFFLYALFSCFLFGSVKARAAEPAAAETRETKAHFDAAGKLRSLYAGEYGTFSVDAFNLSVFLTDSYEDLTVRRKYDENMRLVSKEHWNIVFPAEKSSVLLTETFFYDAGSAVPFKCVIENFAEKKITEVVFNERGLKAEQHTYLKISGKTESSASSAISAADNSATAGGSSDILRDLKPDAAAQKQNLILSESLLWKYDDENRILEYEKHGYAGGKKNSQKSVYSYDAPGEEPDYVFYDNGVMRFKRIFSDIDAYTETSYFDGGFTVEALYKHGIKKEENFFLNGRLQNRIEYEIE